MKSLLYYVLTLVIITGFQKAAVAEQRDTPSKQPVSAMSIEEQKREAFNILKEILVISESPDREKNIPKIKALYLEIIDNYPDLKLAQESYLRLVILAKEENTPEGDAEAEKIYQEFKQKYPNSPLKLIIEDELKEK